MTHFMQLPNKTITLLDQELALKNGEMTFEFGGTEKILVTETALQNAIAGMSAPLTVATKAELDALTNEQVDIHKRIFVEDDGDAKWAYYMITDISGATPAYIKVSDEDIFGALFSDDVTAQISKIGDLADLEPGMLNPATLIEGINTAYNQGVALNTRVGANADLTTTQNGTIVAAMNELVVNITSNDGDILTIQNNIGDLATINLTDALDKETVVAAINKVLAVQATKLDAEDVVPIIVSYTGLLTELSTTNQNSLVEAINEIVLDVQTQEDAQISIIGDLANLVTEDKTNIVTAINELHSDAITENAARVAAEGVITTNLTNETNRATTAEALVQTNLDTEAATRAANDGDLATLATEVKSNLVAAINEVHTDVDTEAARAIAAELDLTTNLNTEIQARTDADTAIQNELDVTQVGAGLETDGTYAADATTNYIPTATSLKNANKLLDAQAKLNQTAIETEVTRATDAEAVIQADVDANQTAIEQTASDIQAELDATQVAAGLTVDGAYVQNTEANYIATAVTLSDADNKLDAQAKVQADALIAEAATRLAADQTLQGNIDTTNDNLAQEVTDRTDADDALDIRIDNEITRASTVEGTLGSLTTDVKDNLVNALNEVDANADTNAANLASEITNRIADVDAEEARATTAEGVLTTDLATEATTARDAELLNTNAIVTEKDRAEAAELVLTNGLAQEVTDRQTADGSLVFDESLNTIDNSDPENPVTVVPADLTEAVNAENDRATTSEAAIIASITALEAGENETTIDLQAQIDAEIARAEGVEGDLDTRITNEVAALIDAAPEALDTLNELAAAMNDDENFSTTVLNDIAQAKAELVNSASEAMDTMGEIETAFNANIATQTATDDAQDQALTDEITRATTAEGVNTTAITTEATTARAAELVLTDNLAAEATTARAAELLLTNNLAQEVTDRTADDATELARAEAAELVLTNNLAQEVLDRIAGDDALDTRVDTEITDRTNADNALDARITTVEGQVNGNIGDLANLTTDDKTNLVAAINEVDANTDVNTAGLATEVAARIDAVSAEEAARIATDGNLQIELDATQVGAGLETDGTYTAIGAYDETTNVTGGHYIGTAANLKDADKKLDAAVKVNETALATETAARIAGDAQQGTDLDTERAARIAADDILTADLATELARAQAAETVNATAIATETTRATVAEGNLGFNAALTVDDGQGGTVLASNLTEAINAEVARASAVEIALNSDLSAEITRATGAESTLNTAIIAEKDRAEAAELTLTTNLTSETTRASDAETVLQGNIDTEASTRAANDLALQGNLDAEAATRLANDGTLVFDAPLADSTNLTDAINAELLRATTAEAANTTLIGNETARAEGIEAGIVADLATETARATAAEGVNADAITALEAGTSALVGDLTNLDTVDQTNVVGAINEVNTETDINTNQVSVIKAFINDMLNKSGKTLDSVTLTANTAYSIDITDLASTNVTVTVYSVDGTVLSQEYGMFIDIDTVAGTVSITSSIDVNAKVVIASDISGLTLA